MMTAAQIRSRLGISGIALLIALVLFLFFFFTGHALLLFVDLCVLVPLSFVALFRAFRYIVRHSLWSLRNRLLTVYALFGILPVLLLFVLFALATWSFMSELAIYLANSALDRRIDAVQDALNAMKQLPIERRPETAQALANGFRAYQPGTVFYVNDRNGSYRFPPNSPDLDVPAGWKDVHGLLVYKHQFFGWAHYKDSSQEITVLSPLSDQVIADLVPNFGVIDLVEPGHGRGETFMVGSLHMPEPGSETDGGVIPRAVNNLDVPIEWPSTQAHFHLESPGVTHQAVLWVHSRPSAVMRAFFYDSDLFRGFIADSLIVIAIVFLLVELAAVVLGISLSRRITRAVNQLYEGTQQVISGDFGHRIAVQSRDQLGVLTTSFNQMTEHLERLLAAEKERERLQAELAIAREVQSQLYPRGEPPHCGFRLTARCDPARMVSGDYYDYQLIGKNKLAFAIGDVAGKGISAALLMATIASALRAQVSQSQPEHPNECSAVPEIDSAALVSKLNKQVYAHTTPEKFATFFFGLYDNSTRALTYTNAGHLSPLLFRNGSVVPLDTNGTVIGAFPSPQYDASCIEISDGDLLVCYTDGITEPENAYGEMFGEERLIDLVSKHVHAEDDEIIRIVFDAVRSWTGVPELSDDMTLLLARQAANT